MNDKFAIATTAIAFCLTLSKRQCNSLLRLVENTPSERLWVVGVDGLNGLEKRGLVYWHQDAEGRPNGFGGLTYVGKLVASLVKEAGLTIENTNTAIVLKRVERHGQ